MSDDFRGLKINVSTSTPLAPGTGAAQSTQQTSESKSTKISLVTFDYLF